MSLAMVVPREPIIMAFKMQWVVGSGGAYAINPGISAEDFKNLNWNGGSTPIRDELARQHTCRSHHHTRLCKKKKQ